MRAVDLIRHKRDGGTLDAEAIQAFVRGVSDGSWPDYQVAALLMAIVWRGMTVEETFVLTDAMLRSGERLRFDDVPGPKVDKHSTGGVGDKVSLVLAPLLAACGAIVPMMSGRGLGHTGGTLDKLEAIPRFRTGLDRDAIRRALAAAGCCIFGPTAEITPADRALYALRDVTATVESVALITASILSKKLAEGLDALVFDVKVGRGAFMASEAEARRLAESLVETGRRSGLKVQALLTAMDAPLGRAVGNALEVREAIEVLHGRGPADVVNLSVALAAPLLVMGGLAADETGAAARARDALATGRARERFAAMIEAQGGDARVVDDPERLPVAPARETVTSAEAGFLQTIDAGDVARAALALGAGRDRADEGVDHAVGIVLPVATGDRVERGQPLAEIHHRDGRGLDVASALMRRALVVGPTRGVDSPLVLGRVMEGGAPSPPNA